jgi:hypothetical protein
VNDRADGQDGARAANSFGFYFFRHPLTLMILRVL